MNRVKRSTLFAKLDADHNVVPVDDVHEFAFWFETADRIVGKTSVNGFVISTVFLGIDYGFGGPPLWFETMIFIDEENPPASELGGKIDEWRSGQQRRYATWEEAAAGHEQFVQIIREGLF